MGCQNMVRRSSEREVSGIQWGVESVEGINSGGCWVSGWGKLLRVLDMG